MPMKKLRVVTWMHKKIVDPLLQILKKFCTIIYWGAEPRELAFSTAVGFALGVFPIFGVTIFLCGVAIAMLGERCHAPTIMLTNFVVTPLELSLVIPFLRLGESISGGAHFPLTQDALKLVVTGQASSEILLAVLHALVGWFVASPFMFGTTYFVSLPCFRVLVKRFKPTASPNQALHLDPSDIKIKLVGWFVASPFMFGTTYFVSLPCFRVLVKRFKPTASPNQALHLDPSDIKIKVRDL